MASASLYIRLSREAQAENLSKEGMLKDLEAIAAQEGLEVVATHIDDGISGAVRNRPEFLAWLADGREGRADTLIAWHADRMTREGVNVAAMILDVVEGKDTTTGKVTRPPVRLMDSKGLDSRADETAFRFRFVIAAEVARGERARMSDRTKSAKARITAAGRWRGGDTPFGFRAVPNPSGPGVVLEQHPEEAAMVREAATRVINGDALQSVVRWANGPEGVPPRRAKAWSRATLRQTLCGHPVAGKVVRRVNGSRTEVEAVRSESGDAVTIPAILTPDESAAVRAVLTPKADDRKRGGRQPSRLLSGVLRCSGCDGVLYVARPGRRHGSTTEAVNYRCVIGKEQGLCKRPVQVQALQVEAYVEGRFLAAHGDRPAVVRRTSVAGAAAVESAEAAKSAALVALGQSTTPEAFAALQEAQRVLDEALARPQTAEVALVPTGRSIRETYASADVAERREMISANFASITILPANRDWGSRRPTIDPRRVVMLAQPPFPASEPAEDYGHSRVVGEDAAVEDWAEADDVAVYERGSHLRSV